MKSNPFLGVMQSFRVRKDDFSVIKKICRADSERYANESHFIRCAILKLIREESTRLNIKHKIILK